MEASGSSACSSSSCSHLGSLQSRCSSLSGSEEEERRPSGGFAVCEAVNPHYLAFLLTSRCCRFVSTHFLDSPSNLRNLHYSALRAAGNLSRSL